MEGTFIEDSRRPRIWWIQLCRWLWNKRGIIWSTIILSILLNLLAALLFFRWPWSTNPRIAENGSFVAWVLQNPGILLLSGIILLLLTGIVGLTSRLDEGLSDKTLKRQYLRRMIRETEFLALTGTPSGLISQSVRLDEVFIPLHLRPNRPLTDYPFPDDQLEHIHESLQAGGASESIQRVLIEAERAWHRLPPRDRIGIDHLWQSLSRDMPVAVIQGYPGMGKSTLMARLILHMARRSLNRSDPTLGSIFNPPCIPLLLRLGAYAAELSKASPISVDLSLSDYLTPMLGHFHLFGLAPWIRQHLQSGHCLVLLDGLDEVSDLQMRKQVQENIRTFIRDYQDTSDIYFNRFLITSRVAGYDQMAFPDYPHYTIAELTEEQIEGFLLCWCSASLRRDRRLASVDHVDQEETILRKAEQMTDKLKTAVKGHPGIRDLAENPLLLTLLAVIQQNSIELPRQRIELYAVVTHMLLENRNLAKGLLPIPEDLTIERLGPIAFHMQEIGESFLRQKDTMDFLKQSIAKVGGTADQIAQEAEYFLGRIRERGGIFVQRTGDYFGFFHRTFQEYFTARYVLNQTKYDPGRWITDLANKAHHRADLWREPFLLAVAYKSGEDETVARQIIDTLLAISDGADMASQTRDVLLAAECLVEAKPLTLGAELEQRIGVRLLQIYKEAPQQQRQKQFNVHDQVEAVMRNWLVSLPGEAYRPTVLTVLRDALGDRRQVARQHSTLTLLSRIASQMASCPALVFNALIPPLLALANLPPVGSYSPDPEFSPALDLKVTALAVFTLSFIGKQGPGGALLADVHRHIREHPDHLRFLAHCSLERHMLLTPTAVPRTEGRLRPYIFALERWSVLYNHHTRDRVTEREINRCLTIHRILLHCAEEVAYPCMIHLVNIFLVAENQLDQSWPQAVQDYLSEQLTSGSYVTYQEVILLWSTLFPEAKDMEKLVFLIGAHLSSWGSSVQRFALRFLAMLGHYQRVLQSIRDLRTQQDQPMPLLSRIECAVQVLLALQFQQVLRAEQDQQVLLILRDSEDDQTLLVILALRAMRAFRNRRMLLDLARLFLTHESAEKALEGLSLGALAAGADPAETIDRLLILLGRTLWIREADEKGDTILQELQQIARTVCSSLAPDDNGESEIRLNIVRSLPARSADEIALVVQHAEETTDERIQKDCAHALRYSAPQTPEAWKKLEVATQSTVKSIGTAAKGRLQRKE